MKNSSLVSVAEFGLSPKIFFNCLNFIYVLKLNHVSEIYTSCTLPYLTLLLVSVIQTLINRLNFQFN